MKLTWKNLRLILSLVNFQSGIAVFAVPYVVQIVSLSVYSVLQVITLIFNIWLIFNVIDYDNKRSTMHETIYSYNKVYGLLYHIFSYIVFLPLSPIKSISDLCKIIYSQTHEYQVYIIVSIVIFILIHIKQKYLFTMQYFLAPSFMFILIYAAVEMFGKPKSEIYYTPIDSLASFQYTFLFFSTMYQTYAHDFSKEQSLKLVFTLAYSLNTIITFSIGVIGCVYNFWLSGNILTLIPPTNFFKVLCVFYTIQQIINATILLQKYQFFSGQIECSKMKNLNYIDVPIEKKEQIEAGVEQEQEIKEKKEDQQVHKETKQEIETQENQKETLLSDNEIKVLKPYQIVLNELIPIIVLILVFTVNFYFTKNLSMSLNFCANFGALFVYTVPGIILSSKFNNYVKHGLVASLTIWSTTCCATQIYQSSIGGY